jgi:hypothetical protein
MDLTERLASERRGRLAAERLLEQKTRELFAANEKLALHARSLSDQIVEQRHVVTSARSEAEELKGQNSRFLHDLERAHTAAVMAERRLWDSINTINDGFAVYDSQLRLATANHAYTAFFQNRTVSPGTSYPELVALAAETGIVDRQGEDQQVWTRRMNARLEEDPVPDETAAGCGWWTAARGMAMWSALSSTSPNRCASGPRSRRCPMDLCFLTGRNGF